MKQRIRIPSPIHLELIVISANISPIFLKKSQDECNEKWKSGGELDGKLYHPRKSGSRSNHQSIWNSHQAQYFTNIPKNHFTRGGQAKVQIRSDAEWVDPANQHDGSTNPSGTDDHKMWFWLDLFSMTTKILCWHQFYKTLWAIIWQTLCGATNQFLSKPSLMWRNFEKPFTLHGSQAPMVYSHEKQL